MMRSHPTAQTQYEYLQEAIKHPPADKTVCMEWPFTLNPMGYGVVARPRKLKPTSHVALVHRLAYVFSRGPILSEQFFVCHHCDNPRCFRPSHLFLGTNKDNVQDCIHKGRWGIRCYAHGETHGCSKLTETQIREMNAMYLSSTYKKKNIAKLFGITYSQLTRIAARRNWAHLTDLSWKR